jgi:GPH family glycoside/pentoside/hexuronide:cation symporter
MVSSESTPQAGVKFSFGKKVSWGLASFGTSVISGIYGALLPIFYTDYLGLSKQSSIIALVSILYAIWNAINDPLFGFISDSTKSKRGRRIPYMRFTAPFLAITFALVWWGDPLWSDIAKFWWMLITMLLYDTAYTIIGLVYSALLPEITEDEGQRNHLQISSSFFSLLGMILGFLLPDLFRHDLMLLRFAMIGVGIVAAAFIMFTTYKFKERPEFSKLDKPLGLLAAIKHTFNKRSFIVLVLANFGSIFMQSIVVGSVYYLADYVVGIPTIILLIYLFVPLILGIWLTPFLQRWFGVVLADQILLVIGGLGLVAIYFLPADLIYIGLICAGFGLVGPLIFTNIMFAQVADEDELKTGVRREAAFFGVNALITKPAQSLALWIPAFLLGINGFIPRNEITGVIYPYQPLPAILAMRLFVGLLPGIALLVEAALLSFYPLRGNKLKDMQHKILILHDEKHKKLKEMSR